MNKLIKADTIICILIDGQGMIYYSNTDRALAREYLEKSLIFDYLPIDSTFNYYVGYYNVNVDKIILNNVHYYLILIQSQKDLDKYAYKDLMTGLYNRNYWEKLVSGTLSDSLSKRFSLIIIDVDNLKYLNDKKGHVAGDIAIKIVGQAIKQSIRSQDIGVRYGGDEFLILLAGTNKIMAQKVIDRIRKKINRKCKKENIEIQISAGIACCDCIGNIEDIIEMADRELYREKKIKKSKKTKDSVKLKDLLYEIEKLRDILNNKDNEGTNNKEMLELSQKLSKLISEYAVDE